MEKSTEAKIDLILSQGDQTKTATVTLTTENVEANS